MQVFSWFAVQKRIWTLDDMLQSREWAKCMQLYTVVRHMMRRASSIFSKSADSLGDYRGSLRLGSKTRICIQITGAKWLCPPMVDMFGSDTQCGQERFTLTNHAYLLGSLEGKKYDERTTTDLDIIVGLITARFVRTSSDVPSLPVPSLKIRKSLGLG